LCVLWDPYSLDGVGESPDGGTFPDGSTVEGTLDVTAYKWPAKSMSAYSRGAPPQEEPVWLGSIVTGQRDASGLFYRRNRYYDPQANQFTQEDPISIAGGLNTYGFAGGGSSFVFRSLRIERTTVSPGVSHTGCGAGSLATANAGNGGGHRKP
jgi:hypothetical protein